VVSYRAPWIAQAERELLKHVSDAAQCPRYEVKLGEVQVARNRRILRGVKSRLQLQLSFISKDHIRKLHRVKAIASSECFHDQGLRLDAQRLGVDDLAACSNCGATIGRKLNSDRLAALASRFFVWGSLLRCEYGAAPQIQFNQRQKTSITVPSWPEADMRLIERALCVGFFHYGPRLCMIGEVEPLKALQNPTSSSTVIGRILREYPERTLRPENTFYRIRKAPSSPDQPDEYDSPPLPLAGNGRLDSPGFPVMYASPDLEVCVHECRVTAEDDLYVATLGAVSSLRVLARLPAE
jgi:hypothetical protein